MCKVRAYELWNVCAKPRGARLRGPKRRFSLLEEGVEPQKRPFKLFVEDQLPLRVFPVHSKRALLFPRSRGIEPRSRRSFSRTAEPRGPNSQGKF